MKHALSFVLQNIQEPYIHAVKSELGDRYSEGMDEAYREIFKFILQHIEEGIQQAHQKKSSLTAEELAKYSKATTTKAQLKRQISLSKQEEFFGKDYDKDKIGALLKQESLEREYLQGEARQSTSGLEIPVSKKPALDVISDKSPVSDTHMDPAGTQETSPLLDDDTQNEDTNVHVDKDTNVDAPNEKAEKDTKHKGTNDTKPLLCNTESVDSDTVKADTNHIIRTDESRVIDTCAEDNHACDNSTSQWLGGRNVLGRDQTALF